MLPSAHLRACTSAAHEDATHTSEPQAEAPPTAAANATIDTGLPRSESAWESSGFGPRRHPRERYVILGEHGRGGLGRVWRAYDRELCRDVAIKELLSRSPVKEIRLLREALITARLDHPGIVPIYEAGRWPDGTPFYAMKLVAGRPLRELLVERATADERLQLLPHLIAVADAVGYAHGRHIIHRDLKPANILVGERGETVVIDWGIAKDLGAADEPPAIGYARGSASPDDGLTSAGAVLGTRAYMAPEQRRGEPVDPRADVYAIGAMLWELCAPGCALEDDAAERERILRSAGIRGELVAIAGKALTADLDDRYPDGEALAADLRAFQAGERVTAHRYSTLACAVQWVRRRAAAILTASC